MKQYVCDDGPIWHRGGAERYAAPPRYSFDVQKQNSEAQPYLGTLTVERTTQRSGGAPGEILTPSLTATFVVTFVEEGKRWRCEGNPRGRLTTRLDPEPDERTLPIQCAEFLQQLCDTTARQPREPTDRSTDLSGFDASGVYSLRSKRFRDAGSDNDCSEWLKDLERTAKVRTIFVSAMDDVLLGGELGEADRMVGAAVTGRSVGVHWRDYNHGGDFDGWGRLELAIEGDRVAGRGWEFLGSSATAQVCRATFDVEGERSAL